MASIKYISSTATQCNLFCCEKKSKSVQVNVSQSSKSIQYKLDVENKLNDEHNKITKRNVATQVFEQDLPLAIEKAVYVLKTVPGYYYLIYQV
jgi:hypothetical protein